MEHQNNGHGRAAQAAGLRRAKDNDGMGWESLVTDNDGLDECWTFACAELLLL